MPTWRLGQSTVGGKASHSELDNTRYDQEGQVARDKSLRSRRQLRPSVTEAIPSKKRNWARGK